MSENLPRVATPAVAIHEFCPGLFVHDGWKRFIGFRIQRCMTIVRLDNGDLLVHSPNTLCGELRAELDRLGPVRFVVLPNKMHGHAADQFIAAYPRVKVFGAPGLAERRRDLVLEGTLGERPEPAWCGVLDQALVGGNAFFTELVFLHRASKTLIVTDLIENIGPEHVSFWGRCVCRLASCYGRAAPSPEHAMYTVDPDAALASLTRIGQWDFDRIILAHGSRIEQGGKEIFARVAAELVERARKRGALRRRIFAWMAKIQ